MGTRKRKRRGAAAAIVAAMLLGAFALPSVSTASTTVGSNLGATPNAAFTCPAGCTFSQTTLPIAAFPLASPIDGTIVRWRIMTRMMNSGSIALRIVAPLAGGSFTGAGRSADVRVPTTAGATLFPVQLPIQAGDLVGVETDPGTQLQAFANGQTGARMAEFQPPLTNGTPAMPAAFRAATSSR